MSHSFSKSCSKVSLIFTMILILVSMHSTDDVPLLSVFSHLTVCQLMTCHYCLVFCPVCCHLVSPFSRTRHLHFGLPRFIFLATVTCNIVLFIPSVYVTLGTCVPLSRCPHFSCDPTSYFLSPTGNMRISVVCIFLLSFLVAKHSVMAG